MGHYYINDPKLASNKKTIEYTFLSEKLAFITDNGVFSKDRVDFGTNVLLNSLEDLNSFESVLDVGCGVGIIGICLGKKYKQLQVEMVDVNERAIQLSNENIIKNKLSNCKSYLSSMYENVSGTFDLIVSNPPIRAGKEIVHGIASGAFGHLNENGSFYAVIQKKQGADSLQKKLLEVFGNVEVVNKKNGYIILKAIKNKC